MVVSGGDSASSRTNDTRTTRLFADLYSPRYIRPVLLSTLAYAHYCLFRVHSRRYRNPTLAFRNAHGAAATISNYGGTLTSLRVPNKNGNCGDVVLGFEDVSGYQSPAFRKANPYFGALIGRYSNRITKGQLTLDGETY